MTTRQTSIDEDDFQAFVDGQLPPERCRAVMAYLAANPDESARMSDYRTLGESMHERFDEVLYEPLPVRLRVEHYRGRASWRDRLQRWFGFGVFGLTPRLVGLAALLAASAAGGWWTHGSQYTAAVEPPPVTYTRQAASAHMVYASNSSHPVEFSADQEDTFLPYAAERMGQTVPVPVLQETGYSLIGARLVPAGGMPATLLMYQDPAGNRISLYIRTRWTAASESQPDGTIHYLTESKLGAVWWVEGPFFYQLAGTDRERLFAIADAVQLQLNAPVISVPPEQAASNEKDAT